MKAFFSRYGYSTIKMFINQFAIGIFGAVLSMATITAGNDLLTIAVSIFAVLFYLFLIYHMIWEVGAKDRLAVDYDKLPNRPYFGFVIGLVANIPNLLIAILQTVAAIFAGAEWASAIKAGSAVAYVVIDGMYTGLGGAITLSVNGVATSLNSFWWMYYLIMIPSLLMTGFAYFLGHKNFRIASVFGIEPKKPEQGKKKD